MPRIELKGKFLAVMPIETVGNDLQKQTIFFELPGYTDEYGDKKGKDEIWEIDCLGDNIAKQKLDATFEQKKAKLTIWVNSKEVKMPDNKKAYFLNAVLSSYQLAP